MAHNLEQTCNSNFTMSEEPEVRSGRKTHQKEDVKPGLNDRKKENSHGRQGYHHNQNFSSFDQQFFNNINYKELLTRQRSFINPKSVHVQANLVDEQFNLQRQRSFVVPHQYQARGNQQRVKISAPIVNRGKPPMEIYRPPTMRNPNENGTPAQYNGKPAHQYDGQYRSAIQDKPGLNIHAKEFVSSSPRSALQHSKSSGDVLALQGNRQGNRLQHSKSGHNLKAGTIFDSRGENTSPPRVHFNDDAQNEPDKKGRSNMLLTESSSHAGGSPVKRSKSLGSADFRNSFLSERSPLSDIGPFAQNIEAIISKALNDPNTLNARQLMDVVKHVCLRVLETSRYAEPIARLCISIIEKENGETFLETLLNTCQEYFQEKDRLLRNTPASTYPGYVASHPKWIAFMSFLNEMYTQLKRRSIQLMTQRMQNSGNLPGLVLLTLLAQCCGVCLRESSVNSLSETECLFFVLTAVGRDIETEIPQQMSRVMAAARDAFLQSVHVAAVRKTLLQLIEMHAARWQLPAPAVMYYYPGSGHST